MHPLHVCFNYGNCYDGGKGVLLAVALKGRAGTINSEYSRTGKNDAYKRSASTKAEGQQAQGFRSRYVQK